MTGLAIAVWCVCGFLTTGAACWIAGGRFTVGDLIMCSTLGLVPGPFGILFVIFSVASRFDDVRIF